MVVRADEVHPFEFEGLQIRDYTLGLPVDSSLAEITVEPNVRHRLAMSRRSSKYYFVLEGELTFEIDGKSIGLAAGDLVVIPPETRFRYWNDGAPARTLLVHTPPFALEDEVFLED